MGWFWVALVLFIICVILAIGILVFVVDAIELRRQLRSYEVMVK